MYNLQYSEATYDSSVCLTENNLIANLNKKPQVIDTLHFAQKGYTMNFMTSAFGSDGTGRLRLANDNVSWAVQQRPFAPIIFRGYVSGSTASDGTVIALTQNAPALGDSLKTQGGYVVQVVSVPTKVTGGYSVKLKSVVTVPTSEFAVNKKAGHIGTKFPNGSKQGYGRVAGLDWYHNWFTIARKSLDVDNSLLTTVTWVTNPTDGSKYWFFNYQKQLLEQHQWELEQQRWFGQKTTTDNGSTWMTDDEGNPIVSGAGYIEQTAGANSDTYVPYNSNLVEKIKDRIVSLIEFGGAATYAKITAHTGDGYGARAFDAAMRDDFKEGYKTLFYNAVAGKEIEVGEQFKSYSFMGKDVVLMPNMLFIDPRIHVGTQIEGKDSSAYDMYFFPVYAAGQGQNIASAYRVDAQGRGDRRFIAKYEAGMISPESGAPMWAASGYDGHKEHYLSEHMLAVFNPEETASLKAVAAS